MNIGVFFLDTGANDYPLNKELYRETYSLLSALVQKTGHQFYIVRGNASYLGNRVFSDSWKISATGEIKNTGKIELDLLYEKSIKGVHFANDGKLKQVNTNEFNELCTDKEKTHMLLSAFSPKSFVANNQTELTHFLSEIPGEIKVVKPVDGDEGRGIIIDTAEKILAEKTEFPLMVQEFIDTSGGIPEVGIQGVHDLRIIFVGKNPVMCFVRTPTTPGEKRCNISLGGKTTVIPLETVPQNFLKMAMSIQKTFESTFSEDLIFSVDMCQNQNQEVKLMECNARVGLFKYKEDVSVLEHIAAFLVKAAEPTA